MRSAYIPAHVDVCKNIGLRKRMYFLRVSTRRQLRAFPQLCLYMRARKRKAGKTKRMDIYRERDLRDKEREGE